MSTPFAIVGAGPSGLDVGLADVLALWQSALELALLHSLWQVGVIGVLVAAVFVIRPDLGPPTRAAIASTALLLSAAVFSITLLSALHGTGFEPESMSAMATATPVGSAAEGLPLDAGATRSFSSTVTSGLWLVGFALLNLWTLARVVRAHRLRTDAGDAPAHWQRRFKELLQRQHLSDRVRLRVSRIADSAMVIGWLKPAILVPAAAFTAMPPAQLEAVLLHEIAHLRRRDPLLELLQQLALNLLFFHPIAWWLRRVVVEQREFACDDAATAEIPERRDLARALLRLHALRHAAAASEFSTSLSSQGGSLMTRIERLTSESTHSLVHRRLRSSMITMAAIATLGVSMTLAWAGPTNPPTASKVSAMQAEMLEAWAARLKKAVADGEIAEHDAKSMYGRLAAAMATDRSPVENTPKRAFKSSTHRMEALDELIKEGKIAHENARPRLERLDAKFEARNERDEINEIEAAFVAVEKKLEAGILTEEEAEAIFERLELAIEEFEQDDD